MAITTAPGATTAAAREIGDRPEVHEVVLVDDPRPRRHAHQEERPDELDDQPGPQRVLPQRRLLEVQQHLAGRGFDLRVLVGDHGHGIPLARRQTVTITSPNCRRGPPAGG